MTDRKQLKKHKTYKRIVKSVSFFVVGIFIINACIEPPIFKAKVNDENNFNNSENEISLITYNIQTVYGKNEKKLISLSDYLDNQLFDFVLLQEVFDEDARKYLVENVDPSYYRSIIPRVDYDSFPTNIYQDAGLYSASKFPIIDLSNIDFGENTVISNGAIHQMLIKEFSISLDFMANKSVLGTLYQIDDSTKLFLFTTHIQAISSKRHKRTQLKQIQAFIENAAITVLKNKVVESSQNLIVLLTGDFNYDAYDNSDVDIMQQNLGSPRDLYQEFNNDLKEYTLIIKLFNLYKRFDYIFAYDEIGPIQLKKVRVKSINVTDVVDKDENSISDHLAIKATLAID